MWRFLQQTFRLVKKGDGNGYYGNIYLFQIDGKDVAGMMNPLTEYSKSRPPFWSPYIAVENIDECFIKAKKLGAKVVAPPEDIPNVGKVGMLLDPTGAPICLMQALIKNQKN